MKAGGDCCSEWPVSTRGHSSDQPNQRARLNLNWQQPADGKPDIPVTHYPAGRLLRFQSKWICRGGSTSSSLLYSLVRQRRYVSKPRVARFGYRTLGRWHQLRPTLKELVQPNPKNNALKEHTRPRYNNPVRALTGLNCIYVYWVARRALQPRALIHNAVGVEDEQDNDY